MESLPSVRADLTFIGNATALLRLGRFTVLTDPAFGGRGSRVSLGYGLWTRRLTDPVLPAGGLDGLDAVLLSHLHGDHFDRAARRVLPASVPIITTPQAERRLERTKFSGALGLPTWDRHDVVDGDQTLRITAVPGRHGPGVADRLLPDVMGSVVELLVGPECVLRLYITGDTLYRPFLHDIPERCGPVDAMMIHLGGTRVLGMLVTMDGDQGVQLTDRIRPTMTIPIHYDDYRAFTSPLSDFQSRARDSGITGVRPVVRGDRVALPVRTAA